MTTQPAGREGGEDHRLTAEQAAAMAANGVVGAASGLFGALAVAGALVWIEPASPAQVAVWLALIAAAYAVHVVICVRCRRQPPQPAASRRWCRAFVAVALAEGGIWGLGIVWFCATGPLEQELLVVLIAGGIAGGVGLSFGSYLPAYFARFLPATLPYVVWAAVVAPGSRAIHGVLATCVLAFAAGSVQLARGFNAGFVAGELTRFRNLDLAAELRVQKDAAEAATLAKSRFLAAASHDLRQPVHALSLFVGALHGAELSAESQRLLEQIRASVAAVDGLFAALLDISRLDSGIIQVNPAAFSIQELLDRICRDHAAEAAEKGIVLRLHPSSAVVRTDRVLLERLLRNLISNAIRYTDAGRVVVGTRRGPRLTVQIWDTGRGIAREEQARVFDEFHQLTQPGAERGPGLGLGLAVVRRLGELLDLRVQLRSEPGRGSCFSLSLPIAHPSEMPSEPPAPWPTPAPGRIMVIDDNPGIRQAMAALLFQWGHHPVPAASGETAMAGEPGRPDLILCDYHLGPGRDGIAAIANLRRHFSAPIPAILITADTTPELHAAARQAGLLLLQKPVSNARLRAAIGRLLAQGKAQEKDWGKSFPPDPVNT